MPKRPRVAVLCGGPSAEREVSLRSGKGVHAALLRKGWDADLVAIDDLNGLPKLLSPYALVFNILHGGPGEDGTVQLLLDLMGKPYVGSGPLASALAMDKLESHRLFQGKGLPVPEWVHVSRGELSPLMARVESLGFPVVLKPRKEGSSIGVRLARDPTELAEAAPELLSQFGELLVERYIPGKEVTVAVLEREDEVLVLPVVELRPRHGLFDWTAKYTPGECEFLCPADLPPETALRAGEVAKEAHLLLGCRDFSRADLRISPSGIPYILEVNTLPGMTEMSTFPRAAQAAGIPYDDLVDLLLRRAQARLPKGSSLG